MVCSRGSNAPFTSGYCWRKSQPSRSVRDWSLYSAATVQEAGVTRAMPFQPETVVLSPSETSRLILAGADQVAPAGGVPVGTS